MRVDFRFYLFLHAPVEVSHCACHGVVEASVIEASATGATFVLDQGLTELRHRLQALYTYPSMLTN